MTGFRRVPLSHQTRADVWDASCGICHYCKTALHPLRNFHVDHVHPVSAGGTNERSNLVAACRCCNLRKNAQSIDIFLGTANRPKPLKGDQKPIIHRVPTIPLEQLDTIPNAATQFAVTESTIRYWIDNGKLRHYRFGRGGRVSLAAVAELTKAAA